MRKPKPVEKTIEPEYPKLEATRKISEFNLFGAGGRIILSAALVATLATGCSVFGPRRLAGDQVRAPEECVIGEHPGSPLHLDGSVAICPRIHFDFDKARIRSGDVSGLEHFATLLKESPNLKVLIEGHCDDRGSTEYNMALGQRRADVAREFLISRGVDPARIETISYGEERPAIQGEAEKYWSQNRRAEFKLSAGKKP